MTCRSCLDACGSRVLLSCLPPDRPPAHPPLDQPHSSPQLQVACTLHQHALLRLYQDCRPAELPEGGCLPVSPPPRLE